MGVFVFVNPHPPYRQLRLPLLFVPHRGGSGLGLYIAAGIVELHEGCAVWATSPGIGLGSTFYLQFPVATAPHQPDEAIDIPLQDIPFFSTPTAQGANNVAENVEKVENLNVLIAVRGWTLARLALSGR